MSDEQAITLTASLAFDLLKEKSPEAADMLRFFSFCQPDNIPWELFTQGVEQLGPGLANVPKGDVDALRGLLEDAAQFALVFFNEAEQICNVNSWVQEIVRNKMSPGEQRDWIFRSVKATRSALPMSDVSDWMRWDRLLPHTRVAKTLIEENAVNDREAGLLLNDVGYYLYQRGHSIEAEEFSEQAASFWEKSLGPDSVDLAITLTTWA